MHRHEDLARCYWAALLGRGLTVPPWRPLEAVLKQTGDMPRPESLTGSSRMLLITGGRELRVGERIPAAE